jgi:hypothetical protein
LYGVVWLEAGRLCGIVWGCYKIPLGSMCVV